MRCSKAKRWLDALVFDELKGAKGDQLARHLAGCPGCAQVMARRRRLREHVRSASRSIPNFHEDDPTYWPEVRLRLLGESRPADARRPWARWIPVGVAGAAAALALAVALFSARPQAVSKEGGAAGATVSAKPAPSAPTREDHVPGGWQPPIPLDVMPVGVEAQVFHAQSAACPLRQATRVRSNNDVVEF